MPFTLAHPAAVLPLRRTGLPFQALVVGSMSPDFEYLVRLAPTSVVSHTPIGLVVFCLPASLAVLFLLDALWMPALRELLGGVAPASSGPVATSARSAWGRGLPAVAPAILAGALTHLAWDSFTHEHGWMVERLPILSRSLFVTPWGAVRAYQFLQHGSTLAGMALLAAVALRGASRPLAVPAAALRAAALAGALAMVVAFLAGLTRAQGGSGLPFARTFVGTGVLAGAGALMLLLTLYGLLRRVKQAPAGNRR